MKENEIRVPGISPAEAVKKAADKDTLKNHNPNQQHNIKKEALGPNTKRS